MRRRESFAISHVLATARMKPLKRARNVDAVMRTLARAIDGLDLPAVEKISQSQEEIPSRF